MERAVVGILIHRESQLAEEAEGLEELAGKGSGLGGVRRRVWIAEKKAGGHVLSCIHTAHLKAKIARADLQAGLGVRRAGRSLYRHRESELLRVVGREGGHIGRRVHAELPPLPISGAVFKEQIQF